MSGGFSDHHCYTELELEKHCSLIDPLGFLVLINVVWQLPKYCTVVG